MNAQTEVAEDKVGQTRKLMHWLLAGKHINTTESPKILEIGNSSLPRRVLDLIHKKGINVRYGKEIYQSKSSGPILVSCYYIMPADQLSAMFKLNIPRDQLWPNLVSSVTLLRYANDISYNITDKWLNEVQDAVTRFEANRCINMHMNRKHPVKKIVAEAAQNL